MLAKLKDLWRVLIGRQSARGATVISVFFGAVGKVLGYGRTLAVVWLFGASGGVDAFYVAMGIMSLLVTTASTVLSSTLLPFMVSSTEDIGQNFFVKTWRVFMVGTAAILIFMAMFPRDIVLFFAQNLDNQRLDQATQSLLLMFPWAIGMIHQSFLNVWGSYLGRYNVVNSILNTWNLLAIILIWGLSKIWGALAIAQAYSLSIVAVTVFMWVILHDMPMKLRLKNSHPQLTRQFCCDSFACLGIVGASSLFQVVDRYFGSALPAGGIAALGFSSVIYTLPVQLLAPVFFIYLVKASEKAEAPEALEQLKIVLLLAWGYLFPIGCVLAVVAPHVVALLFGHGAFSSEAVSLTARCVAMAAPIIPFAAWQMILFRHAQAQHRLILIMLISYAGVALNGLLDWLFLPIWGAPGLSLATSLMWSAISLAYFVVLAPKLILPILSSLSMSSFIMVGIAGFLYMLNTQLTSSMVNLLIVGVIIPTYFIGGDLLGLFNFLPLQWRPVKILKYVLKIK